VELEGGEKAKDPSGLNCRIGIKGARRRNMETKIRDLRRGCIEHSLMLYNKIIKTMINLKNLILAISYIPIFNLNMG